MKKICRVVFFTLLAALLFSFMPAAAPEVPILHEDTLALLQAGDFPLSGSQAPNHTVLLQFFSTPNRAGAKESIRTSLIARAESVDLSTFSLSPSDLKSVLQELLNDCPEFFHVGKQYSYYTEGGLVTALLPTYTCSAADYPVMLQTYEQAMRSLLALHDESWSTIETVLFYHDYLAQHYSYDDDAPYNFDAYSFLTQKTGVCQAYTLTFTALMNRLGIPVSFAQSEAMSHIWNLVRIDGKWYHLDVTWDDPSPDYPGQVLHNLFLLSDDAIREEDHHDWITPNGTECTSARFDRAALRRVTSPLVFLHQSWFGFDGNSGAISAYDPLTGTVGNALHTVTDGWPSASGGQYAMKFSGLTANEGILYFNTPTAICALDPFSGSVTEVHAPALSGTSVFCLYGGDDGLVFALSSAPSRAPALRQIPYPDLTHPDLTKPIHLYKGSRFAGSYSRIADALSAASGADTHYTLALLPQSAVQPIAFDAASVPSLPASLTLCPLIGTDPVAVKIGSTLSVECDLILNGVALVSSASSSVLQIGANSVTLSGSSSVGTAAAPIDIRGSAASSLTLDAQTAPISTYGKINVGAVLLSGEWHLGASLTASVLDLSSASLISLSSSASAIQLERLTGAQKLTLQPRAETPPSIGISGSVNAQIVYRYPLSYLDRVLITAPSLAEDDLRLIASLGSADVDVTPLSARSADGQFYRGSDRYMEIENGVVTAYLSVVENDRVTIPSDAHAIAPEAFASCPTLASVLIPASVTEIGLHGVGYINKDGTLLPHPDFLIRAEDGSAAARYAQENGITCSLYTVETNGTFTYRFYADRHIAELTEWHSAASSLVIPSLLYAENSVQCQVIVDADLTAGRTGLSIFSPFPSGSMQNPYEAAWAKKHAYYPEGSWHTLSLMLDRTLLRKIPLPTAAPVSDALFTPQRPDEGNVSFRFLGWDATGDGTVDSLPEFLSGDLTLTAVFERLVNQHTVTWCDAVGNPILVQTLSHGEIIVPPAPPTMPDTAMHRYRFLYWNGYTEGMTADRSLTMIAVYEQSIRSYTYRFLDEDGTVLAQTAADYGSLILPPASPQKPDDESYRYTFSHWQGYVKNLTLTGDVSFTAVYIRTDIHLSHPSDITSDQYAVVHGYASGIAPATTVSAMLACFDQTAYLRLTAWDGTEIGQEENVKTGMTLALLGPDGLTVLKSVTVVVTGDLSGDGVCSITDFIRLKSHLLGIDVLSGASAEAADMNADNTVTLTDFIQMRAVLLSAMQ